MFVLNDYYNGHIDIVGITYMNLQPQIDLLGNNYSTYYVLVIIYSYLIQIILLVIQINILIS